MILDRDAVIRRFTHPLVRALAWAIGSYSAFSPAYVRWNGQLADDAQGAQWLQEAVPWLEKLEREPGPLERRLPPAERRPLGKSFELLVGFWLEHRADIAWAQHSVVVRRNGRTVGEFDHVYATRDGALHTLELTVKFYLRVAPERGANGYVGPMVFDFMAQKIGRMIEHQMPLGQKDDGQRAIKAMLTRMRVKHDDAAPLTVRAHALSRGVLFERAGMLMTQIPDEVGLHHGRGTWCLKQECAEIACANEPVWKVLEGVQWLGPQRALERELVTLTACAQMIGKARHVMVARFVAVGAAWEEAERMMVLAPDASALKLFQES